MKSSFNNIVKYKYSKGWRRYMSEPIPIPSSTSLHLEMTYEKETRDIENRSISLNIKMPELKSGTKTLTGLRLKYPRKSCFLN